MNEELNNKVSVLEDELKKLRKRFIYLVKDVKDLSDELSRVKRSVNRDSEEQWLYLSELSTELNIKKHPVTGFITPKDARSILIKNLCSRDGGN